MYFIGVDLGTSAVKLLLMDEEGKIVIQAGLSRNRKTGGSRAKRESASW